MMRTTTGYLITGALALSALGNGACYVTARPAGYVTTTQQYNQPQQQGAVIVTQPQVQNSVGVTVVEASCVQGAQEACNGLDDNCNGQIDEGCGYQSGAIQITSSWNTGADIDMYVIDPQGNEISYSNTTSPTGGQLDHDARGACTNTGNIENVYWSTPQPPNGTYQIFLDYYSECSQGGPTTAQVSISVGGRVIGVYSITLIPDQHRVPVTSFTI